MNKYSEIELLAKAKLNLIVEKFIKAIKDGQITDEEYDDTEQELKNYENMKSNILNKYKKLKKKLKLNKDEQN